MADFDWQDPEATRDLIARSSDREGDALAQLIAGVTPVVRRRSARVLARRGGPRRVDVDDLAQEALAHLFAHDARALRAWAPERGLHFLGFVGLLAERAAAVAMRGRKRDPRRETLTAHGALPECGDVAVSSARIEARDELRRLLTRTDQRLSPAGRRYLRSLVIEGRPIDVIASETGASAQALYAWRSRLRRLLHQVRLELDAESARVPIVQAEPAHGGVGGREGRKLLVR